MSAPMLDPNMPPEIRARVEQAHKQIPDPAQFMAAYRKIWGDWQHQAAQQRMSLANTRGSTPRSQVVATPQQQLQQQQQQQQPQQHGTPTPQPRPAGQIRPSRPLPHHAPVSQVAPPSHPIFGHRAPPPPRPLNIKRSDPPPFFTDLNARHHYQAAFTTYPSRLRLGLTSLMQPIGPGGQTTSAISNQPPQTSVFQSGSALGKRQRQVVNYAEMENYDDLEESSSSAEDEQPRSARVAAMNARKAAQAQTSGQSTPGTATPLSGGKTYLGQLPPSNLIMVEPAKKTKHVYPSESRLLEHAGKKPILVPIRIELDTETHRIRDCFMWDLSEPFLTPELFAQTFCDDVGLVSHSYRDQVASSIRAQIDELTGVAEIPLLTPEQEAENVEMDLRVVINIQTLHLTDRIEWDLSSQLTPELFARQLAAELGLGGEASPLIAHAVHEELIRHKKDCLERGLVGSAAGKDTTRGAKKMEGVWRDLHDASDFGPRVEELTPEDIDRVEVDRERHSRRVRRDRDQINQGGRSTRRR